MPTCDRIEILRRQRPKAAVCIVGMVQDDHSHALRGPYGGHQLGPVTQFVIRNWAIRHNWEGIKMAGLGGDLVANDTGEKPRRACGLHDRLVIHMVIMIGGNRQLDTFPGDCVHAFLHGGVTVTAVGQAMNV